MAEHFAVSQPFWSLALVCPHGQRYLSKRSPLGEGLGGDSQRDQGIRLTQRWGAVGYCDGTSHRLLAVGHHTSVGPGHRFTRQPRCSRPSPAKSTELCPGLLHRQGGWVFVPHGAYRGRLPHRCYCHGWEACVVVTLPLTAWLSSYDAKVDR